ncbi:hypothetical protein DXT68_05665 [Microbacterium foliorum]|uniref:Secreted protein n=1 Tax=Microbacterium foliorum TaxID=104336 RepID=A0A0F0KDJ0_9MICO|nr:hypothetical protein [Microbacterium foliorum]AXL11682.1 hypothetical protein DXT68_05665 [Microbacterium foliorum]KJL18200.1 hypothetical protein RN50_03308 [Microbacterium foliorum]
MKKNRGAKLGVAIAVAAGITLFGVTPASASEFGPYSSPQQCNADRTDFVRGGGRASPCVPGTGGWYFQSYQ